MSDPTPGAATPSGPSKLPVILGLLNTVAVLAAVGFFAYTKLMFKRPVITETSEREKITAKKDVPKKPAEPGLVAFEAVTINIEANPGSRTDQEGQLHPPPSGAKIHYLTLGFSVQFRDSPDKDDIESTKAIFMDHLIANLGRKKFSELNTVQGRFLLRAEMIDLYNGLIAERKPASESHGDTEQKVQRAVVDVYFTQYILQ